MAFSQQGSGSSFPIFFPSRASSGPSQQPPSAGVRGFASEMNTSSPFLPLQESQFDILEWYPQFQSCVRYFLDHAQYDGPVQAMAAFVNIQLPFQKSQYPIVSSRSSGSPLAVPSPPSAAAGKLPLPNQPPVSVSLNPFIRRLVATGFDFPGVLHGFFGDNWAAGISRLHEVERRNYLFAAKSASWLDVKSQYDMPDGQSIPFLRPLQNVTEKEIVGAEATWSEWLAMQDWMVGPRNPEADQDMPPVFVKREND
ncbi:Uu.00g088840.m01.CDS01 [Anthostomella pinea]|uniref:Uu.00g088840.m01.CDS01 n=1 Tax=Anthostomella pinea TaxID=933095 RepID=A0AAI8YK92_9PEZI|nr:Uu.00g088840.m01.CDS01 [Anthostomella pinea]